MSGIQKDLGPKGFQVLEAAFNEGADIPGFVLQFLPAFPVGVVDRMTAAGYMQISPMVRTYVPYLLLIDRQGMIRAQWTGGDDFLRDEAVQDKNIRAEVEKLLAEPASHRTPKKKT